MRRPWEPEELARIRDIARGDIARVARELGRSRLSVESARWRLGVGVRKYAWSPEEDVFLDRLVADGGSVENAAAAIGRSRLSAYMRRDKRKGRGVPVAVARRGARVY